MAKELENCTFKPTINKPKTTLKTSGEDKKTTLKTSGEDKKTTLKTSVEIQSPRIFKPTLTLMPLQPGILKVNLFCLF